MHLELAEFYHYDSVRRLISLTDNVDQLPIGESLAAVCLLRSYEIITRQWTLRLWTYPNCFN